jgi:D-proline reductase (dithiol) PrdB
MHKEFEGRSADSKRQNDGGLGESPVNRLLQQSAETLQLNYDWIGQFQSEHPDYSFVKNEEIPWTDLKVDLFEARVALVTTVGVHVKDQKPFSISPEEVAPELAQFNFREKGDPSIRLIPASVDAGELWIAHPYLDVSGVEEDVNVVFPLERLQELVEENLIGEVAPQHISFMGYAPDPADLESAAKEAVEHLKEEQVDVVVLTPGEVLSHQSMVVIQRAIEAAGIATISIALCRDVVESVGTPRAVHYGFPFGFTLGESNDQAVQLRILKDTLRSLEDIDQPGTIVDLPYEWV